MPLVEPRGIYRERKGRGDQDSARVNYDEHQELDLPDNAGKASRQAPDLRLLLTFCPDPRTSI